MDFWMLKELNAQVLFDLREFVPKGHFVRENPLIINGVDTSHDEKWGYLALALGERLLYESQAHLLTGSARQIAAIELLISLGMLASFKITHHERPKALNDMLVSLRKYLNHLGEREAKPFVFLLDSDASKQRMNEDRAFLNSCFKAGIEKDINSIWLHIQNNAGKEGFRFKTSNKSTATTIDDEIVDKKKLGRCLSNLIK